ncbi:MAG: Holliday junction resolvase RuvX [Acidobacteria bacterium]|nr:MAG: Holliday junction resolvase RuvX [Acidobacteriota bacterium]
MGLPVVVSQSGTDSSAGPVLAIDYGRKRFGLAVSDALRLTARPLATWSRSNRRHDLARLRSLCREQGIRLIVVGWPLQLGGTRGEMASEAARFAERIRADLGIPVELVDERLSSWEARQALAETAAGKPRFRSRKQDRLDEVAAAVILRDYLRRTGGTA